LIANEIKKSTKTLHLFDSFRGLPKPGPKDHLKNDIFHLGNIGAYTGKMSSPRRRIVHELSRIKFPKSRRVVHCGEIESLIARSKLLPRKVSFAYVDFDFYSPTRVTLEFLDTVTTVGSIVVVDDYDYFSTGVKSAVDEFLKKHRDYEILVANKGFGCFAVLKKISNNPKGYKEGSHG